MFAIKQCKHFSENALEGERLHNICKGNGVSKLISEFVRDVNLLELTLISLRKAVKTSVCKGLPIVNMCCSLSIVRTEKKYV